jgi:hypothetical protein
VSQETSIPLVGSPVSVAGFGKPVADDITTMMAVINGLLQSTTAQATAPATAVTTEVDVPGCSVMVTPTGAHAVAYVFATWDMHKTTAGACQALGKVYLDGVAISGNAPSCWDATGSTFIDRQSLTFMVPVPVSASAHTIKLRVSRQSGTGTLNCEQGGSGITVILLDVP